MLAALKALNQLVADGVVENYAIGGAIGASFYVDALQTEDIDAFVFLPVSASGLVSLTPIYKALKAQGGVERREYIQFGEWPLQILSDANPLVREAIRDARTIQYELVSTRIFTPEHLCVIALQTGRRKDDLRVILFVEQERVDREVLMQLADRYGLRERLLSILKGNE